MAEEKRTYYVSVQAGSIVPNEGDTGFEFVIEATPKEISELYELFDGKEEADNAAFLRSHVPFLEYQHDKPNDVHDWHLAEVYRKLHELGTPETKRHIESMGVLGGELLKEPVDVPRDTVP